MGPESRFYYRIRPKLVALPRSYWFPRAAFSAIDLNGMINGVPIALELKATKKGKRSKRQAYVLKKITQAGGFAVFVYPENWDSIYDILRKFSRGDFGREDIYTVS